MTAFIALPLVADTQAVKSPLFTVWFVTSRIANTAGKDIFLRLKSVFKFLYSFLKSRNAIIHCNVFVVSVFDCLKHFNFSDVVNRLGHYTGETVGGAISRRLTKLLTLTRRGGILKA